MNLKLFFLYKLGFNFLDGQPLNIKSLLQDLAWVIWQEVWPRLLETLFVCLPLFHLSQFMTFLPPALQLQVIIGSMMWMFLFSTICVPLRGTNINNFFSLMIQSFWITKLGIYALAKQDVTVGILTHVLGCACIDFIPANKSAKHVLSVRQWPIWCYWISWIVCHLIFRIPECYHLGIQIGMWIVIMMATKISKQDLTFPRSIWIICTCLILSLMRSYWNLRWLDPVLWINLFSILLEANRKVDQGQDWLKYVREALPELILSLGHEFRHLVTFLGTIVRYAKVPLIVFSIYGILYTMGGLDWIIFRPLLTLTSVLTVLGTGVCNLLILLGRMYSWMQYQESEIEQLKTKHDKDLTASERAALMMHKGGKIKSRDLRLLRKGAKKNHLK